MKTASDPEISCLDIQHIEINVPVSKGIRTKMYNVTLFDKAKPGNLQGFLMAPLIKTVNHKN